MLRAFLKLGFFREKALKELPDAKKALDEVRSLYRKGELKNALLKLEEAEEKYPACTKAATYYRGKIGAEFLDKLAKTDKSDMSNFSKK